MKDKTIFAVFILALVILTLSLLLTTTCSDETNTDTGTNPDSTPDLHTALEAKGFRVQNGKLREIDLSECCDTGRNCSLNNPSSPYLTLIVPRAPGQTVPNLEEDADGTSWIFRVREDEAFVVVGRTPPEVAYFGFTPYLFDRDYGGTRRTVFASLGETLNHEVIGVEGSGTLFDRRFAIILTGNASTEAGVHAALLASGIPDAAINLVTLDPQIVRFGIDETSDAIAFIARVALFTDPMAGNSWIADPGATIYRVTPTMGAPADPLPSPAARMKPLSPDETTMGLDAALDRLEVAIRTSYTGAMVSRFDAEPPSVDPETCIETGIPCFGDNRDAIYPNLGSTSLQLRPFDAIYAIGVDHTVTGKATYASASVYALSHLVGIAAVTSADWHGSAERFLPGDPDAPSLFAWRIARDCTGDPFCLEISEGECPYGAGLLAPLTMIFRIYVEPGAGTAPDPARLVYERVLHIRP